MKKLMKKMLYTVGVLLLSIPAFSQVSIKEKYLKADSFLKAGNLPEAYRIYQKIKPEIDKSDTLYNYVIWYYVNTASQLAKDAMMKEEYANSLTYNLETLKLIQENKARFDQKFAEREQWTVKNIVVSYFGLGDIDKAKSYKSLLYQAYKDKSLPQGIDEYFNFDFFKIGDKNIWGYEWYPELPDNRFSSSFTKVVYYVYSTKPDGTDKEQLYRFHVLMFHQDSKEAKFDYILERQQTVDDATVSGSYYKYTYKKDIDYKKLREDVKTIVKADTQPDTRRVTSKKN